MNSEVLLNIIYIYSIKRLYTVHPKYSKLLYIFFLSPLIISSGFFNINVVSKKYWNFLRNMCYPNSKSLIYNGTCSNYHTRCSTTYLANDAKSIFNKIIYLYLKYYVIHGIYSILVLNKSYNYIIKKECYNCIQSTLFLFLQNILQRLFMCNIKNLSYVGLYIGTTVSSIPICIENIKRVNQINTMMISNVVIEIINNYYKKSKTFIGTLLLILSFSKERSIHLPTVALSIINGINESDTFGSPWKLVNKELHVLMDDTPILSIPWHPFL